MGEEIKKYPKIYAVLHTFLVLVPNYMFLMSVKLIAIKIEIVLAETTCKKSGRNPENILQFDLFHLKS